MAVWLPTLCAILVLILAQQYAVWRGIQGLYAAKMKVAEGKLAENFADNVPDADGDAVQELPGQ